MSVRIEIEYEGGLRCSAVHAPSGARLATDAPKDNMGKGESFSPSDLLATALGTCLVTIMGIHAQREGLDIDGVRVSVDKHMIAAPVRRIARLDVRITVPAGKAARLTPDARQKLEQAARMCPVCASIHADVEKKLEFIYPV